jgi:hypothetical protein
MGRKGILMKLHLAHCTFASIMIVSTSVACFAGKDSHAQRQSSSLARGPISVHLSGGPQGSEGHSEGHKSLEVPRTKLLQQWTHVES